MQAVTESLTALDDPQNTVLLFFQKLILIQLLLPFKSVRETASNGRSLGPREHGSILILVLAMHMGIYLESRFTISKDRSTLYIYINITTSLRVVKNPQPWAVQLYQPNPRCGQCYVNGRTSPVNIATAFHGDGLTCAVRRSSSIRVVALLHYYNILSVDLS